MRAFSAVALVAIFFPLSAWSQSRNVQIENCEMVEAVKILTANFHARDWSHYAFDLLNLHYHGSKEVQDAYERWFGEAPNDHRVMYVAETYRNIYVQLNAGTTKHACVAPSNQPCKEGAWAYTFPAGDGFVSHYCPKVFPESVDTLWPVIIHEISHLNKVRGTFDHCYGEVNCASLASWDPEKAIRNADSYRLFAKHELSRFMGRALPAGAKLLP